MELGNLFDDQYIKLSDIYNYVHERGKWQSENCYKTCVTLLKDTVIVSNHNTYGTKEEQEIANDSVCLEMKNGYLKICHSWLTLIDLYFLEKYPFMVDITYYTGYWIKCDMQPTKMNFEEEEEENG